MLVSMKTILDDANKNYYGVMAMNSINMEMARAGITAAEDFFDTYKDKRIYIDDRAPNLMFAKCVYRLARNYYKF